MILTYVSNSTSTSLTLPGFQAPFDYKNQRYQELGETEDGTLKAYDHQINRYFIQGQILIGSALWGSLDNFIRNTIKFAYSTLWLTPDPSLNLGSGFGSKVAIRYWDNDFNWRRISPDRYEIGLNFRRVAT